MDFYRLGLNDRTNSCRVTGDFTLNSIISTRMYIQAQSEGQPLPCIFLKKAGHDTYLQGWVLQAFEDSRYLG